MRVLHLTIALLALTSPFLDSLPAAEGPIHRYSFDNPASNDATDAVITDSVGGADGVVLGDGSSFTGTELTLFGGPSDFAAYVDLPNGLISGLTDVSVEGWITVEGNQNWQRVFDFGSTMDGELDGPGPGGEGQDYFMLSAARGTEINQQRLELRNNDPDFGGDDPGNVAGTQQILDTNLATSLDEEYHFAVVYNSAGLSPEFREYRNGSLVGTQPVTIELGNINDVNNWLGRSNWTADANFEGKYNEFRIYDYSLADNQVLGNYENGPDVVDVVEPEIPEPPEPPKPEPLPAAPIHRYSFNNPASNDATDAIITDSIGGADGVVLGDGSSLTGTDLQLFGGTSDVAAYVDLPNGLISGLTDVSVEGWITIQGDGQSWQRVFDFGSTIDGELDEPGGGGEGQDYFMLSAARGTNISQQRLELRNNDPDFGGDDPGNVVGTQEVLDTDIPTALDEEYHFAVVYELEGESGTPQFHEYRNGQLVGTQNVTIELGNINDVNNWLGRSNWTVDANFEGSYNEFRIYDYALTENQVLGNHDAGADVINAPDVEPQLQPGDADQDYDFDQIDLVQVQISAKFLTGESATWGEGDWNAAPGGKQGDPPPGNGLFDQLDIIAALAADWYLKGKYAALGPSGQAGDAQTSIKYDARTGELAVDAPAGVELTSINIESATGIFTGDAALNLDGSFDNDADSNIFKATFGDSFGSLSFGNVAEVGLDEQFLLGDLTVIGSLGSGGGLGDVDLIYIPVPEPASIILCLAGLVALCVASRSPRVHVAGSSPSTYGSPHRRREKPPRLRGGSLTFNLRILQRVSRD